LTELGFYTPLDTKYIILKTLLKKLSLIQQNQTTENKITQKNYLS